MNSVENIDVNNLMRNYNKIESENKILKKTINQLCMEIQKYEKQIEEDIKYCDIIRSDYEKVLLNSSNK